MKTSVRSALQQAYRQVTGRFPATRKLLRAAVFQGTKLTYRLRTARATTNPKQVVFCTFSGQSYSDSPKAIYERMRTDPRFQDWEFMWVFKGAERYRGEYGASVGFPVEDTRTRVVEYFTPAYEAALGTAKYWVFNYRVNEYIYPRADQVYIECWHGTPLKRLGHDLSLGGNVYNSLEEVFRKFDLDRDKMTYLLSPSPFASEKFSSAWDLQRHHRESALLEVGYPRNDFLVNATARDVAAIKARLGLDALEGKKVILYAPTWRDNQRSTDEGGFTYALGLDFQRLRQALGEEYVVLFRAHYLVASQFDFSGFGGFVYNVSDYPDINHLYLAADLLITDYSSVFFDYAILHKPMLFYMYDLEAYRDEIRGFYMGLEELPGPIVEREEDLAPAIRETMTTGAYDEKYRAFCAKFAPLEDGHASDRVIDALLAAGAQSRNREGTP
ncbi:MAG: CDP-glycerol glycerophosphotransferase family protein [Clostridiales bacterium]|nr:CDP-glycerol glycerophosphotransferase family protein [Clostridiales bacterium]